MTDTAIGGGGGGGFAMVVGPRFAPLAKPVCLQRLERALRLDGLVAQVERTLNDKSLDEELNTTVSKQQSKAVKTRIYNLSKVKKNKKWLKNILLDKTDDEDDDSSANSDIESELKADDCIREMLRFHRLDKKVRKECRLQTDPQQQLMQYQHYSTSLLNPIQEQFMVSTNTNKTPNSRSKSAKVSVSKSKKSKTTTTTITTPAIAVISNVTTNNAAIEVKTEDTNNTNLPTITDPLALLDKPIKVEKIGLDDITYDTQLPKEILQTESSNTSPFVELSVTSSFTQSSNVTNLLPDDIFDTEESCGSVLSQTLSQPTPTHPTMTNFSMPKCATAPTTPTCLSPSTSPVLPSRASKRSTKKKSTTTSLISDESTMNARRKRLWITIARKEIPKLYKQKQMLRKEALNNCKKIANWCQRQQRKRTLIHQKQLCRDQYPRARRLTKEMLLYWKHFDKVEKDYRKRAEKEAQEQMKFDIELLEAKRQQRKLNFLITQTELYSHFLCRKILRSAESQSLDKQQSIVEQLDEIPLTLSSGLVDNYDSDEQKRDAISKAQTALLAHRHRTTVFDTKITDKLSTDVCVLDPQNMAEEEEDLSQPNLFCGFLKSYQLKGVNWLYNLYVNGINGILADEMGLGKTVQTIAFLATLTERLKIWGPFLIIAPTSTLHNWQQELTRFVPKFRVLPYWGNPNDRKALRKLWNKYLHCEESPFHVLITSYQIVIQDAKYFQPLNWLYMVLDEAQAIKSSCSQRWKHLLSFQCRNRLLLTGTPVQNSMGELWALLHFIMPTMFDSHQEFADWFSKDIESHAENKSAIDEKHLSRLHMILKPFLLRRFKKDVENELSDKIEMKLLCPLTTRQRQLYCALQHKLSLDELVATNVQTTTTSLMNLVMQFRKVCNHPNLFERRQMVSPYAMKLQTYILPSLIYESGLCFDSFEFNSLRHQLLYKVFNIFNCDYINESLLKNDDPFKCFSFMPLIGLTGSQLFRQFVCTNLLINCWQNILHEISLRSNFYNNIQWSESENSTKQLLLIPLKTTYFSHNYHNRQQTESSNLWTHMLFTWSQSSYIYTFTRQSLRYISDSLKDREMRLKETKISKDELNNKCDNYNSDSETQTSPTISRYLDSIQKVLCPRIYDCEPTSIPLFLSMNCLNQTNGLKVISQPMPMFSRSRRAMNRYFIEIKGGNVDIKQLLITGNVLTDGLYLHSHEIIEKQKTQFYPQPLNGILGLRKLNGWSPIEVPDRESIVTDSGKMKILDDLLKKLKNEGHRVLIYCQMTRMIDLLEEYMCLRKHSYIRLDGSSKISDRRDMVEDFQNKSDIFVFLLSTRAGGLGINLTAADTVIFYDSDWNPTVDQQAMDRAHRLGQTKQVTVYRLICKATIEERILQRAEEKSQIHRMVISVDTFKPDLLKPTEMVSLLLNDEDLERRFCQQLEERRLQIKESTATTTTATTPVKQQTKRKLKAKQSSPQSAKKKCSKRFNPENNEIFKDISHYSVDDIESYNDNESESNSPYSEQMLSITTEGDCNNDELYVDDHNSLSSMSSPMSGSSGRKKCGGRGRGRPRGSKTRATVTTRSSLTSAALAAAELAGAQAGKSAALAVYPFLSSSHQSSGGNTQNNNNNNNSIVANLNQRRNRGARSGRSKNWTTIDN